MARLEYKLFKRLAPLIAALTPPAERNNPLRLWRAQCMVVASVLGGFVALSYGFLYYALNDPLLGAGCALASALIAANLGLFRWTSHTTATKHGAVTLAYLLLLGIVSRQGGVESPALVWLAACPMIAFVTNGRRAGIVWALLTAGAIVGVHVANTLAAFPPVRVSDLRLVGTVSAISFMLSISAGLLAFDQVNSGALNRLNEALARINDLAERDELTGVFNRRKLIQVAADVARRSARVSGPFSICILDIDHFKNVNDLYGHAGGDDVLRAFAQTIQREVRDTDCFGRYGGEEFLLILEGTGAAAAVAFAERIRVLAEALDVPGLQAGRGVTVSIGVAQFEPGETVEQTISRADKALYAAKRGGRNRVMVAGADAAAAAAR